MSSFHYFCRILVMSLVLVITNNFIQESYVIARGALDSNNTEIFVLEDRKMVIEGDEITGQLLIQQRLINVESLISHLTSQVEELRFDLSQIRNRLGKLATDVEYQLKSLGEQLHTSTIEDGSNYTDSALTSKRTFTQKPDLIPPTGNKQTGTIQQNKTEQKDIKKQSSLILTLLSRGNYAVAEQVATNFLVTNPNSQQASHIQYLLGEIYYVQGRYLQAATTFATGYRKYPKGSKAPDNMLKLGMSLSRLNRIQDACTAFSQLTIEFPSATNIIKEHTLQERKRIKCK